MTSSTAPPPYSPRPRLALVLCFLIPLTVVLALFAGRSLLARADAVLAPERSPVDLVLTADGRRLLTANQTANTISLIDVPTGRVLTEVPCGQRPAALALTTDERRLLVSNTHSGDVSFFRLEGDRLLREGTLRLGFEPHGIALTSDGKVAYVALNTAGAVAVLDVEKRQEVQRIPCGNWPRYLALSPDGSRLAVGVNGDGGVAVIDTHERKTLYVEDFVGLNLGQMHSSRDGKHVYFPWMVYRHNPITASNIREGWVLASRIARVRLDGRYRREAISLDPRGEAIADPHGFALSPDEQWIACAASGSQELLVYKLPGLPFQDYGGPGDHINADLLKDKARFYRIPLGGRPMFVRFAPDGRRVFVANYLLNAVQVVDIVDRKIAQTIALGGPTEASLARRGEAIFYDGKRSLDQWYSCHSCHYEGHTNAVTMDTRNDGRDRNFKTVLSLRNVSHTGPWFWHGWQKDFDTALRRSLTETLLGKEPSDADVKALAAYLDTLRPPPNPHRTPNGDLSESARRGEVVFQSEKTGCSRCHSGPYFTDGKIHDVGLGERGDVYKGHNPPSLLGIFDRVRYLHHGQARSLDEVLTGDHNPEKVTGRGKLTDDELNDLIAYLKSL